ncbi:MAG TPA: hypothetical protein VF484_09110, partial [Candidatus Limnocylindrales bacterium]
LDPVVVTIVGVAIGLLAAGVIPFARRQAFGRPALGVSAAAERVASVSVIVVLVAIGIANWPAAADPNGGWPAAEAAGARVAAKTAGGTIWMLSVPDFKTPEVMTFPIVKAGGAIGDEGPTWATSWVVVCDRLFQSVVGKDCGGPAEDALVSSMAGRSSMQPPALVERFDATPRTSVSIYSALPVGGMPRSAPITTTPMDGTMTAQ